MENAKKMPQNQNTSLSIYFATDYEKKAVFEYANKRGFPTLKQYLEDLLFCEQTGEEILRIKRNARFSIPVSTGKWSRLKYIFNLAADKKQYIQELAKEKNMSVNTYILSRIKTDMALYGYNFLDHFYRYIVFFRDMDGLEQSMHMDQLDEALEVVKKEKEKNAQDILLVDALLCKRTYY